MSVLSPLVCWVQVQIIKKLFYQSGLRGGGSELRGNVPKKVIFYDLPNVYFILNQWALHYTSFWLLTIPRKIATSIIYNELSQKTRFQSAPIAALCLYNIQGENLVFKKSLCICHQYNIKCDGKSSKVHWNKTKHVNVKSLHIGIVCKKVEHNKTKILFKKY